MKADMNPLIACMIVGLAGFILAESPVSSGYSYSRSTGGGGYSFGGGGGGGGGRYVHVPFGSQTSEGASVDSVLLEQIRQILLKEEQSEQSGGGFGGGFGDGFGGGFGVGGGFGGGFGGGGGGGGYPSSSYGAPSAQYGPPSTQYGAPPPKARVVNVKLGEIQQASQRAQLEQVGGAPGGGFGGGGGDGAPSAQYVSPSTQHGAPLPKAYFINEGLSEIQYDRQRAYLNQLGGAGGGFGGAPGGYPRGPSTRYGTPNRLPTSTYGAPF